MVAADRLVQGVLVQIVFYRPCSQARLARGPSSSESTLLQHVHGNAEEHDNATGHAEDWW